MINSILFDLDDTLLEEVKSARKAFYAVCKIVETKYGIDQDEFYESVRKNCRNIWHECPEKQFCLDVGISSWEGLWAEYTGNNESLKKLFGWKEYYRNTSWNNALNTFGVKDKEFGKEIANLFVEERKKINNVFPEVVNELVKLSKNYTLALITNGAPDLQWYKINKSGLKSYFSSIIISGEVGIGKPNELIFKNALEKLKRSPEEVVMIGDSLRSDIVGAQNIGIHTIWINRNKLNLIDNIKPDKTINNLKHIGEIIKSIND